MAARDRSQTPVSDRAKLCQNPMNGEEQITQEPITACSGGGDAAWYAVYTRARHEKCVAEQLNIRRIETFLPLQHVVHRWKDRNKPVSLPLFPGYVFVRIVSQDHLSALRLPGVVRLVGFNTLPAPIPDAELESLRLVTGSGALVEPCQYMKEGRRVRICRGVLQGTEGILVRRKGGHRLIVSVDLILRSVAVEVDEADVVPVETVIGVGWDQTRLAAVRGVQGRQISFSPLGAESLRVEAQRRRTGRVDPI